MQEISLGNDEISKSLKQAEEHQKAIKNASLSFKEKKRQELFRRKKTFKKRKNAC